MKLTAERFMEQLENVIRWNSVKGPEDFSQESINKQAGYAREEIRETMAALLASDHKEVLDGVADVFVTYGYKLHQLAKKNLEIDLNFLIKISIQEIEQLQLQSFGDNHLSEMDVLFSALRVCQHNDHADRITLDGVSALVELLYITEVRFCEDIMTVVEHVMDSNWSKYPKIGSVDNTKECFEIQGKNVGRYSDITPVINQEYGVVVFRSDNGTGKIMKPSTFFEPDCAQFLN